jgi:hypothetical protein
MLYILLVPAVIRYGIDIEELERIGEGGCKGIIL